MYIFSGYFGYETFFVFIFSLMSISLGISIIISKNPIFSVLFLIGLFFGIAIYLILLGLNFIGLSYLLVYVGAISILFLFILMLINVRISELVTEGKNSIPLAILAVLAFNSSVNEVLPYNAYISDIRPNFSLDFDLIDNLPLYLYGLVATLGKTIVMYLTYVIASIKNGIWDGILIGNTHIAVIGNILYGALYIFLIITSLILLLAMIGSIVITLNKSKSSSFTYLDDFTLQVKSIYWIHQAFYPYSMLIYRIIWGIICVIWLGWMDYEVLYCTDDLSEQTAECEGDIQYWKSDRASLKRIYESYAEDQDLTERELAEKRGVKQDLQYNKRNLNELYVKLNNLKGEAFMRNRMLTAKPCSISWEDWNRD